MEHFYDEFSKSLATSVPRRESLRRIGAVVAGAVLGQLGLGTAWAARQDPCKSFCRCSNKTQQNQCLAACRACNNNPTRLCGACGNYACCATGTACCGDHCTDLENDFDHCGGCGVRCDDPAPYEYGACVQGACVYGCVEGAVLCDGICTPVSSDFYNCGACGNVCPDWAQRCTEGVCDPCNWPFILCEGVCVDPTSDRNNCGGCGIHCSDSEACMFGFCESGV